MSPFPLAQPNHVHAARQAYVIEIGETQAGLVNRHPDERHFTFIAASAAFDSLDGQRFATPVAAERAARALTLRPHGNGHRAVP